VTRLLDGRHHLERFAMEQAGEVDYLITWTDEFVGRVSLTPCRRAGANRRCFAFPEVAFVPPAVLTPPRPHEVGDPACVRRPHRLTSELLTS